MAGIRSRFKKPKILLALVPRWHVRRELPVILEGQVLSLVLLGEGVAGDLELGAEVVLLDNLVAAKVVASLAVTNQYGLVSLHWGALHLETFIRVNPVNNPLAVVGVHGVQGCLLKFGHGGVNVHVSNGRAKVKDLPMKVLIGLNLNLLTVTDYVIAAKNVLFINFHDTVNITGYWLTFVNEGCVETVGLINVILHDTKILSLIHI